MSESYHEEQQAKVERKREANKAYASLTHVEKGVGLLIPGVETTSDGQALPAVTYGGIAKSRRNLAHEMVYFSEHPEELGKFSSFQEMMQDTIDKAKESEFYVNNKPLGHISNEGEFNTLLHNAASSDLIDLLETGMKGKGLMSIPDLETAKMLDAAKKKGDPVDGRQERLLSFKNTVHEGAGRTKTKSLQVKA